MIGKCITCGGSGISMYITHKTKGQVQSSSMVKRFLDMYFNWYIMAFRGHTHANDIYNLENHFKYIL